MSPGAAVFLDRDGVLNEPRIVSGRPHPPRSLDEVRLIPGAEHACALLREAGLTLICITNQPDIARGTASAVEVDAINEMIQGRLGLDAVVVCPHDDADSCDCRKPMPGMVLDAAARYGLDLERSVVVGDRWRDIEAGRRAGCMTVLLERGYAERPAAGYDHVARNLDEATPWIIDATRRAAPDQRPRNDMLDVTALRVKVFADGADAAAIEDLARNPFIEGFTTNPTLMRAAGITDYEAFARNVLALVPGMPISFEVFADEFGEMVRQARRIASWGDQVFVKIPVTDTKGTPCSAVIRELSAEGIQLNITAMTTVDQVRQVADHLQGDTPAYLSVFAGRIADTGRDPLPIMKACLEVIASRPELQLLWASPRELLNIIQADEIGCHIITVTHDLLKKLPLLGKDLDEFSLETVQMFHRDAVSAGFKL